MKNNFRNKISSTFLVLYHITKELYIFMFRMGLRLILKVTNETLISTQKKKKKREKET